MGVVVARVRFAERVPSLSTIEEALGKRTGLRCHLTREASGRILATCDEFPTSVDVIVRDSIVELEQSIAQGTYFFDQLRQALVSIGGRNCDVRGNEIPGDGAPSTPIVWADRTWSERFVDKHPFITGLIWLAIMIPKGLWELVRRPKK